MRSDLGEPIDENHACQIKSNTPSNLGIISSWVLKRVTNFLSSMLDYLILLFIIRKEFLLGNGEQWTFRKCSTLDFRWHPSFPLSKRLICKTLPLQLLMPLKVDWATETPHSSMGVSIYGSVIGYHQECWKLRRWGQQVTGVCSWWLCLVDGCFGHPGSEQLCPPHMLFHCDLPSHHSP